MRPSFLRLHFNSSLHLLERSSGPTPGSSKFHMHSVRVGGKDLAHEVSDNQNSRYRYSINESLVALPYFLVNGSAILSDPFCPLL